MKRPVGRLGGLSAGQDRRARRRGRRAAAGAGAARHRDAHAAAGLSGGDAAARRAREALHDYAALLGAPARLVAASVEGLELFVLDAPALYDRPAGPMPTPPASDQATTGGGSPRWRGRGPTSPAACCPISCRTWCRRTTGRPG